MNELVHLESKPVNKVRNQVILTLQNGYAHDLIGEEEFEKRLHEATNSDNKTSLISLVNDLPLVNEEETGSTKSTKKYTGDLMINDGHIRKHSTVLTVLGGVDKKGLWKPPKNLNVVTMLGGTDIDFTRAALNPGTTKVRITCIMGGVDIIVPRGVNVEVGGLPIMGGLENKTDDSLDPNAPTLKIKALVIMGGVDIKHPKKIK